MKEIILAICIGSVFACTLQNDKRMSPLDGFDLQGHRGCRGLMPENTIPAMIRALELGVTTLEMDVVISRDGKVVVSHDPWFNHEITTTPEGREITPSQEKDFLLYRMDYDSISLFDVGIKPNPRFPQQTKMRVAKPLLTTLIDSVESYAKARSIYVLYNIETKCTPSGDNIHHPAPEVFVDMLMNVIHDRKIAERVTIQSFDFRTLNYLKRRYPDVKTAALVEFSGHSGLEEQLKDLEFQPDIYSPNYMMVSEKLVRECQERGIRIIPWTVNEFKDMQSLKKMGVDGLISDYPNLYGNLSQ